MDGRMKINKKRPRAPNFKPAEAAYFCNLLDKYKHILDNKRTDGVAAAEKQRTWKTVTMLYNASPCRTPRSMGSLMAYFKNIKAKKKKDSNDSIVIEYDPPLVPPLIEVGLNSPLIDEVRTNGQGSPYNSDMDITQEEYKDSENRTDSEFSYEETSISSHESIPETNLTTRINVLRKPDPILLDNITDKTESRKHKEVNATPFVNLQKSKQDLEGGLERDLRIKIEEEKLNHQRVVHGLELQILNNKLMYSKIKNDMEMQFLKQKYELELELLRNRHNAT